MIANGNGFYCRPLKADYNGSDLPRYDLNAVSWLPRTGRARIKV